MVQLLRDWEVWQETDVNLKGLVISTQNVLEANMSLLRRFLNLDNFCPVARSTPFMQDSDIANTMVLKELHKLPQGFRPFFPFQRDMSARAWLCRPSLLFCIVSGEMVAVGLGHRLELPACTNSAGRGQVRGLHRWRWRICLAHKQVLGLLRLRSSGVDRALRERWPAEYLARVEGAR